VAEQLDWSRGHEVLEVGCGSGWLWAENADRIPADLSLTLSDLSPGMLESAVTRVAGAGVPVAHHAPADVGDLPFDDRSFDLVVANHMLYHATDLARAVSELRRVLRPTGTLVAATNGPRHLRELGEIRMAIFGTSPIDDTVDAFGIESGTAALSTAFSEVSWREYPDQLRCTDPVDVLAYLRSLPPGEGATPDQDRRMVDEVHRRFEVGKGTMTITKESGVLLATG
jgi:SAM-dependent methyltransferase